MIVCFDNAKACIYLFECGIALSVCLYWQGEVLIYDRYHVCGKYICVYLIKKFVCDILIVTFALR